MSDSLTRPSGETTTLIGWLRPVILVPVGSLAGLPLEHMTALLAHELAHIGRHDYLASVLQNVAEADKDG
jgi:beta-lactamase regulating signal transducer with metallopeptidase domain